MAGRPTNEPSNYAAFGFQSAKDTAATTFQFLRHLDGTGAEANEDVESVREGGDGQEVGLRYKTGVSMDGAMVANHRPETGIRLAIACLGADSVSTAIGAGTTASGICNEHMAVPTSQIPYLTYDQYFADEIERVTNVQVTETTWEFEAGRPLKLTSSFVGGGSHFQRDAASALTATRETGQPFMYPGASVTLDGSANTKITKGKITVQRGVDTDIRTTGLNREDVVAQNFNVMVEGTLKYEDRTLYQKVHYTGGSQVPIDLATGSLKLYTQFGSGTAVRYLELGVNQFHYTGARVNKLDPDGKTVYIDFTAEGYKAATYQVFARGNVASVAAIV